MVTESMGGGFNQYRVASTASSRHRESGTPEILKLPGMMLRLSSRLVDMFTANFLCRWLEGMIVCPHTMVAMSREMATKDMDLDPFKGSNNYEQAKCTAWYDIVNGKLCDFVSSRLSNSNNTHGR